jgi:hypothetical protein
MEWVASTLHTTSEHGVSSITTADAHTSAASSRLNRRPRRFKWTRPFRRKTKSGFCACAITFQTRSLTDEETRYIHCTQTSTNMATLRFVEFITVKHINLCFCALHTRSLQDYSSADGVKSRYKLPGPGT